MHVSGELNPHELNGFFRVDYIKHIQDTVKKLPGSISKGSITAVIEGQGNTFMRHCDNCTSNRATFSIADFQVTLCSTCLTLQGRGDQSDLSNVNRNSDYDNDFQGTEEPMDATSSNQVQQNWPAGTFEDINSDTEILIDEDSDTEHECASTSVGDSSSEASKTKGKYFENPCSSATAPFMSHTVGLGNTTGVNDLDDQPVSLLSSDPRMIGIIHGLNNEVDNKGVRGLNGMIFTPLVDNCENFLDIMTYVALRDKGEIKLENLTQYFSILNIPLALNVINNWKAIDYLNVTCPSYSNLARYQEKREWYKFQLEKYFVDMLEKSVDNLTDKEKQSISRATYYFIREAIRMSGSSGRMLVTCLLHLTCNADEMKDFVNKNPVVIRSGLACDAYQASAQKLVEKFLAQNRSFKEILNMVVIHYGYWGIIDPFNGFLKSESLPI